MRTENPTRRISAPPNIGLIDMTDHRIVETISLTFIFVTHFLSIFLSLSYIHSNVFVFHKISLPSASVIIQRYINKIISELSNENGEQQSGIQQQTEGNWGGGEQGGGERACYLISFSSNLTQFYSHLIPSSHSLLFLKHSSSSSSPGRRKTK